MKTIPRLILIRGLWFCAVMKHDDPLPLYHRFGITKEIAHYRWRTGSGGV